jgi:subtilisin family serine protease
MPIDHRRIRTELVGVVLIGALLLTLGTPARGAPSAAGGQAESAKPQAGIYVVQMLEDPVVAYDGGEAGLAPTRPARGQHIDPGSAAVRRYATFLDRRHAQAVAAVGAPADARFYDYRYTFNGFAAELTPGQAAQLAQLPNVVAVTLDERRQVLTDNTPGALGLSTPGGFWETAGVGEDVVIGVIDTGIWPEHPSFSDQADLAFRPGRSGDANRVYGPPPADWHGICQAGEQWSVTHCNNKLIGARYFLEGLTRHGIDPGDYASARDHDGHGTHTASTAGGNAGVDPSIFGRDLGVATIAGMAPRARIAAYKACYGEGCFFSDLVAAIDIAVADGVDVINYSIGSNTPSVLSPDAVSFLFARTDANVFVATSAGNAGPGPGTLGSPAAAPWLTAVGASTHSRVFQNTVTLGAGGGGPYFGGSVTHGAGPARLVDGGTECPGGLDPAEVSGAIVLCHRVTGIARISHGSGVLAAGGVGMILYDPPQVNVTPTDNHVLPTSHVPGPAGFAIADYIADAGPAATASFTAGTRADDPGAPDMAVFSSRGPNGAVPDVIKPDVTAPGVQILAGNSPTPFLGAPGQLFQAIQGTSMSSPHVAGVGALLVGAHPDWSAAMVQSALTTTGHQDVDKEDGTTAADPFDFGGGHIQPMPANDPGLVYDAGLADYLRFLCGAGQIPATSGTCTTFGSDDPSDLNLATIGIGELAGIQTVTRTVTNVGPAGTYTVSVDPPAGIGVDVSPSVLTLGEGEEATYEVTFTTTAAATLDAWVSGSLTWSDGGGHAVRSPISVRPVGLSAPDELNLTGTSGSHTYDVTFGYSGPFGTSTHGLIPATVESRTVVDDPADDINVALATGVGIDVVTIPVAAGTRHLRASLFDENTDGADDLDLYLFDPDGNFVDGSGSATSLEQVDASFPATGDWTLVVHGWQTDGPDALYDLFTWVLGDADAGNLTVTAPATATLGATEPITLAWTGLTVGTRYLGSVSYDNGTDEIGQTLVNIAT